MTVELKVTSGVFSSISWKNAAVAINAHFCVCLCAHADLLFIFADQLKHECPSGSEDGTRATGGRI